MKRYIILLFAVLLIPVCISAQSSMTDDQVFRYIVKEHQEGTSQQQIGIQLIQRGVDVTQLRRVRQKYERLAKEQGLGTMSNSTETTDDRTRNKKKMQGYDGQYDDKTTEEEREKAVAKCGASAEITRFKGLGELNAKEFKDFIGPDMRLTPVECDGDSLLEKTIDFYMGPNSPDRRTYIMENLVCTEESFE